MRLVIPALASLYAAAALLAAGPARADEALAKKHNCLACHRLDKRNGGEGAWGNIPMPPNAAVPEGDIRKLVDWILKMR